jgi:hypothetical protein
MENYLKKLKLADEMDKKGLFKESDAILNDVNKSIKTAQISPFVSNNPYQFQSSVNPGFSAQLNPDSYSGTFGYEAGGGNIAGGVVRDYGKGQQSPLKLGLTPEQIQAYMYMTPDQQRQFMFNMNKRQNEFLYVLQTQGQGAIYNATKGMFKWFDTTSPFSMQDRIKGLTSDLSPAIRDLKVALSNTTNQQQKDFIKREWIKTFSKPPYNNQSFRNLYQMIVNAINQA